MVEDISPSKREFGHLFDLHRRADAPGCGLDLELGRVDLSCLRGGAVPQGERLPNLGGGMQAQPPDSRALEPFRRCGKAVLALRHPADTTSASFGSGHDIGAAICDLDSISGDDGTGDIRGSTANGAPVTGAKLLQMGAGEQGDGLDLDLIRATPVRGRCFSVVGGPLVGRMRPLMRALCSPGTSGSHSPRCLRQTAQTE